MEQTYKNAIKSIFKGTTIALGATFALLLIFSVVLAYTNVSESTITPVIIVVTAISILVGSSIGNMKIKKNGILNGALVGRNIYTNFVFSVKYSKLEF